MAEVEARPLFSDASAGDTSSMVKTPAEVPSLTSSGQHLSMLRVGDQDNAVATSVLNPKEHDDDEEAVDETPNPLQDLTFLDSIFKGDRVADRKIDGPHSYLWDMNMSNQERDWWVLLEKVPFNPWRAFKGFLKRMWTRVSRYIPWGIVPPGPWKRGHESGRSVFINHGHNVGDSNGLTTSKYSIFSLLPKFFFEQYRRISNIYFTIVMVINFIPGVSPILPVTSVIPLLFVLGTAFIKELLEDLVRHISDYRTNSQKYHLVGPDGTVTVASKKIRPGNIIRIDNDQQIPADMVLISSSEPEGAAYVTTANLDGETNLKLLKAPLLVSQLGEDEEKIRQFEGRIDCGPPDKNLYMFNGKLTILSFPVDGQDDQGDDLRTVAHLPRAMHRRRRGFSSPGAFGVLVRDSRARREASESGDDEDELTSVSDDSLVQASSAVEDDDPAWATEDEIKLATGDHLSAPLRKSPPAHESDEGDGESSEFQAVWPLDKSQLLLRGAQLRNTKHAYGVVVYTGKKTKLFLNLSKPPSKFSSIDRKLNQYVALLLLVQQTIVLLLAIASVIFQNFYGDSWYLGKSQYTLVEYFFRNFLTYFVLFNIFVPISLWVTLEVVRTLQARFIGWDAKMRSADGERGPEAKTANLNEDLGLIDFVFSDKTGTLTANVMEFRNASVNGVRYGAWEGLTFPWMSDSPAQPSTHPVEVALRKMHLARLLKVRDIVAKLGRRLKPKSKADGVDADDVEMVFEPIPEAELGPLGEMGAALMKLPAEERLRHPIANYFRVITVCHACVADRDANDNIVYRTPSPDEKALVEAARANGFFYVHRTTDTVTVYELGTPVTYKVLATVDFSSARKRMTTVVRYPNGEIWMLAKGANNVMYDRVSSDSDPLQLSRTDEHVRSFAGTGLRTLVMCERRLSEDEYSSWRTVFDAAATSLEDRDTRIDEAAALIERDWFVIGCSAIEDRLQDEVPETIYFLRQAGIQVWVLTGDMQETAKFIGYSSRLLDADSDLMVLNAETSEECGRKMIELIYSKCPVDAVHTVGARSLKDRLVNIPLSGLLLSWLPPRFRFESKQLVQRNEKLALIVDGKTLEFCLNDHMEKFRWLGRACKAVICCRVSPLQKARVVEAVRRGENKVSLAVGDGANDVSMIQKAHVGVGIFGKEGTQAARSADYAIHEFKHLRRLIAVHGRFNFLRSSGLIQYSFYKNICFSLPFLYCSFTNGFTGQSPYDSWVITFFNMLFTALPPGMYGIWERDVPERACEMYPQLYRPLHQSVYFTRWTFLRWMLSALWHSSVVYFLHMAYYWGNNNVLSDGRTGDLFAMGFGVSLTLIIIVNLRMLIEVEFLNWVWLAVSFGTMIFVVVFQYVFNLIYNPPPHNSFFDYIGWPDYFNNTYYVATIDFGSPFFWFMFVACVVTALAPDLVVKYVKRTYYPEGWVIVRRLHDSIRLDLKLENEAIASYMKQRRKNARTRQIRHAEHIRRRADIRRPLLAVEERIVDQAPGYSATFVGGDSSDGDDGGDFDLQEMHSSVPVARGLGGPREEDDTDDVIDDVDDDDDDDDDSDDVGVEEQEEEDNDARE